MERIFGAVYSTKPGRLGMGLAVCRGILEAHGGKLWATRGAPSGAVLQLILPVSTDEGSVRNPFAAPGSMAL
ncbi:MAG TPA: ATP-binding protein [Roseiarcus sp.]|nr:ATP-binding protein [Roseiarcus sp.]